MKINLMVCNSLNQIKLLFLPEINFCKKCSRNMVQNPSKWKKNDIEIGKKWIIKDPKKKLIGCFLLTDKEKVRINIF